jgi:hypothetical protein
VISDKDLEIVEKLKKVAAELGRKPTRDEFRKISGVSDHQLRKLTYNGYVQLAGLAIYPNKKLADIEVYTPKILLIDIEVAPLKVWSYGIRDQYHSVNSIDEDWNVLSFAAKFLDEEKIYYFHVDPANPRDDSSVVKEAFNLISKCDYLVAHNLAFDLKMLTARWLFYEFHVVRPFQKICTYQIAKCNFRLTSNKLEYLAKYLGVIEKLDHGKFPGMELFKQCAQGNLEAFKELEDYNVRDVVTLEAVFLKLRRYDSRIRFSYFTQENTCSCGSREFREVDPIATSTGIFRTHQCVECGRAYRDQENLLSAQLRKGLFKKI